MKQCPNCGQAYDDMAVICTICGTKIGEIPQPIYQAAPQPVQQPFQQPYQQPFHQPYQQPVQQFTPGVDPFDHTREFTAEDNSDNKAIAMLAYLASWLGIIVAMIAAKSSKYAAFHVRQALKFTLIETLFAFILLSGVAINLVPVVGWLVYVLAAVGAVAAYGLFFVLRVICFIQICKGNAKEPPIIRNLNFLK